MFLETFCILCLIFTVGYFIIAPAKSAWDKLPSNPDRKEYGMEKFCENGFRYDLWKRDKKGNIIQRATANCHFEDEIMSLKKNNGIFEATIRRMDFPVLGPELKRATVRADNLHELSKKIENIFQSWEDAS